MAGRSLRFPWEGASSVTSADCQAKTNETADLRKSVSRPAHERLELETVYRIRRPEVIRYLVSFGVDLVDAEDIAQEAFLQVLDPARRQKYPDNLFHWTMTCAKNLATDRFRRSRKELLAPAVLWKEWEETLPDGRASAESCMHEKDDQLQLARAVAQLSALEQQCLVLRSRGISFREMASALELSMQSAVYTTDVAIQKLQRKLKCVKR
jgi:RNA polymerase sigma factor (sigma-70 family)